MPRDRIHHLILPVAALIAIFPLILHGPSCGHDFTFHITNWLEAAAQFRHGNLHPQWAVSPAWNAGEPRFVFYPPLSWTLGALIGYTIPRFLTGWPAAPIVYTWIALTASGLAMYRLARAHATSAAALIASALYLANPYMLFTAYERTAYAELLSAAFLPLLIRAVLKDHPGIPAIAVPLALLWLTNAPAAVMGTYTLAFLALTRLLAQTRNTIRVPHPSRQHREGWGYNLPSIHFAFTISAGTLLGFALASFYIVPAATERPWVQIAMAVLPGLNAADNTLFHHTGLNEDTIAHDAVLHTASILAILLLILTGVLLLTTSLVRRFRHTRTVRTSQAQKDPSPNQPHALSTSSFWSTQISSPGINPVSPLACLTAIIGLLLTPPSLPIWRHAPELAFLQFPWRLLAVLAVVLALAAALAWDQIVSFLRSSGLNKRPTEIQHHTQSTPMNHPLTAPITALILAAILTLAATPAFRQSCDPEDTVQSLLATFQSHQGVEPTDEYTPAAADNDYLQHRNPPFWLASDPDAPPPGNTATGPAPRDLTLTSPIPQSLILNLRQYPAWHVTLNGHELSSAVLSQTPRADGLVNIPLLAGLDHVHLDYRATPLEHAADALSAIALLLTAFLALRQQGQPA